MAGEMTQEGAAFALLQIIAHSEGKNIDLGRGSAGAPSREWILSTYAQCRYVVGAWEYYENALKYRVPDQ